MLPFLGTHSLYCAKYGQCTDLARGALILQSSPTIARQYITSVDSSTSYRAVICRVTFSRLCTAAGWPLNAAPTHTIATPPRAAENGTYVIPQQRPASCVVNAQKRMPLNIYFF